MLRLYRRYVSNLQQLTQYTETYNRYAHLKRQIAETAYRDMQHLYNTATRPIQQALLF